MENYVVMSFKTTHDAIRGESLVKKENIDARLIPLPPEISAGCGLALRLLAEDKDRIKSIFNKGEVSIDGYFSMVKENGKRKVEKIDG